MSIGNSNTAPQGVQLFPVKQKYDPEEFLTASADGKGHSERFWFRGPTGLKRQIEITLAQHKFPYKTETDVLRHALIRHLYWLATLEPDIPSVMSQAAMVLEVMKEEQYYQDFHNVFEEVNKVVSRYLGGGHSGEALRTVNRCREMIEAMPEGFWRDQYLAELNRKWGYLFQGDGIPLTGTLDDIDSEER